MLNKDSLYTLLGLDVPTDFPGLFIYAQQKSPRLEYTCKFIFNHVLKVNYTVTSDLREFQNSKETKINYSTVEVEGVFQIMPTGLVSENGIKEGKPSSLVKNSALYFYEQANSINFSFDIFSAVFYFISRYEEWQVFEADKHGRFEASVSLLYKNKFHLKPVLDHWILELRNALCQFYPDFKFPTKKFLLLSTIDVDNLYAYKSKGLLRTLGACAKDLLKFDLNNLKERLAVLSGKKRDPFDIYEEVSDFCFEQKIPLIYFFLFRTGTTYDRTVNPSSPAFEKVFKILKENHAWMGVHPSYESSRDKKFLAEEVNHLSQKAKEKIFLSRQHFLRFDIKTTPGLLIANGIKADFSMGFASAPGFRAGTSHPFYYYDFNTEKEADLLFVPFCVMDGVYTVYENVAPGPALEEMIHLVKEIKKTDGLFISVFHERSFSDHLYKGFGTLYKKLHSELKEL